MSGGFFRGTSADQDTRFSNKQAKLMKSQKFAPELEHLVDVTKVKMDVMRPWIAHRVTELIGFEDEVLINFIYGLLDGKVVNGKEIQISLTGFMEKNTGKFMKELWTLLLSAQQNASGVPQQFLDAKEEETKKKKAETDRITNEIQRKKEKEGRELEQEKVDKMDGKVDNSRANNDASERSLRNQPRGSSSRSAAAADEKETNGRNGSRGRSRVSRSPHSVGHSPSSPRGTPSRSISKSFSNSRSYSGERHRSRSISGSPQNRGRSISSERMHRSPRRHFATLRGRDTPRRSISPSRCQTYQFRRGSMLRSRRRSPSPIRRRLRSPKQRRSRSPMRRRSRTPVQHRSRSPVRQRSRSPLRYRSRSPLRYRSRSPIRRRSRSPFWRRSPSPIRSRSPSSVRRRYRRSPSPIRHRETIHSRRRLPAPPGLRSSSPQEGISQSPIRLSPPSPVRRRSPKPQKSSVQSPKNRIRTLGKYSPVHHAPPRENIERPVETRKGSSLERRPPMSMISPQGDPWDRNNSRRKVPFLSPSPYNSPSGSESPPASRKRSLSEDRRSGSPYEGPVGQTREWLIDGGMPSPQWKPIERKPIPDSPQEEETNYSREDEDRKCKSSGKRFTHSSASDEIKDSVEKVHLKDECSRDGLSSRRSGETQSCHDNTELIKKDQQTKSETRPRKVAHFEVSEQESPTKGNLSSERVRLVRESYSEGYKADEKSQSCPNNVKGSGRHESETLSKLSRKVEERNDWSGSVDSDYEASDKHRAEVNEKGKHKRLKRKESDDDDSYDSQLEARKESKRRRKEEKRLRKEERRRWREERRRRKEERHEEKLKLKSVGTVSRPSDFEENHDGYVSDGERVARRKSRASDVEEAEYEQKKLEIELRKKALETLRAKKGIGH